MRRWIGTVLSLTVLFSVLSAQDPTTLGTSDLQQVAQQTMDRSSYAAAVPYLRELDRRLRESTDTTAQRARESVLFYLGLGQLQAAQLDAAASTLAEFLTVFPDSANATVARAYWGDALYYQGELGSARAVYAAVRERHDPNRLESTLRVAYWEHFADCVFADRDWQAGLPIFAALEAVAAIAPDVRRREEMEAKAGSYLLQAAIAVEDFDAALAALPRMTGRGGKTRYDLGLNLALLRGGDELYESGRLGDALYFYEQVLRPAELQRFWTEEAARLEDRQSRLAGVEWFADQRNDVTNALTVAEERLRQLDTMGTQGLSDYTTALDFRIARCYLARGRNYEAYWAFNRLDVAVADGTDRSGFAEEALYGLVKTAAAAGRADRTRRHALRYLRTAEFERFIGDVSNELLQLTLRSGDRAGALELASAFLDRVRLDPALREAPKLIYLVGSTLLDQGETAALRERFAPMLAEFPERGFSDGLHYWLGLAELLAGEHRRALARFAALLDGYPNGSYAEDARYRVGVCWFGLLDYRRARAELTAFLTDFPQSRLVSEAHALLGDLAAAEGRVDEAINRYAEARSAGALLEPPNMGYIDHALFQGGKLLAANGRWVEVAEWFESYLRRWGRNNRAAEAIHELGRAQIALGRAEAATAMWHEAWMEFGNNPDDVGVDLILAAYPEVYDTVHGGSCVPELREARAAARAADRPALALRLTAALMALGETETLALTEDEFDQASPAVLLAIARAVGGESAIAAAAAVWRRAPDSAFAPEALRLLAAARADTGDVEGAINAWRTLAERFPAGSEAATARLREGDLRRGRGEFGAAIAAYREVLRVREWRGEPWAEANYKIGLTHYEAGDYTAAFGFCQRVYVLYGSVGEWAAAAYVTSGKALEELGRADDAAATYRELLAAESLRDQAAATEARERLARLEGRT